MFRNLWPAIRIILGSWLEVLDQEYGISFVLRVDVSSILLGCEHFREPQCCRVMPFLTGNQIEQDMQVHVHLTM